MTRIQDRRWYGWLLAALVALAFGVIAVISIELTRGAGRIAALWLPNAVVVALILGVPRLPVWPTLALSWPANIAANLFVGDEAFTAIGLSLANAVEIAVAVMLVRRLVGRVPDMGRTKDLLGLLFAACIVAPLCSSIIATLVLHPGETTGLLEDAAMWALTDALGMMLAAPILLIFIDAIRNRPAISRGKAKEWIGLTAIGTATVIGVFAQTEFPLLFLSANVVLVHAFRLGLLGTAFSVSKIAIIAMIATSMGLGPITLIDGSLFEQMAVLQLFLASIFALGVPVAAVLSHQRLTMERLAEREAALRLLTDHATDAVIRIDRERRITFASPAFAALLGADPAEAIGRPLLDYVHPDGRADFDAFMAAQAERTHGPATLTFRRALAGTSCDPEFVEISCSALGVADGAEDGDIVACARDVTRRVRLESQLEDARAAAENGARSKSEFLANMSHEIRTPMNGVLGFAQLLVEADLPARSHRHAELIVESGQSMMALLNDILDISKIEAGQVQIKPEVLPLAEMVETCCRMHGPTAEAKGLDLSCTIEEDLPDLVMADPLRMRQILLNLVGNAVKFTDRGHVQIKVCRTDDRMRIAITDTGPGIAPERLEAIFRPFEQEDMSTTRDFGGTGLGLAISHQLARMMKGDITVSSTAGVGTRFTLELPLTVAARREDTEATKVQGTRAHRSGALVLLVEDHDLNQILMREMIERTGQRVVLATDGLEAVTKVLEAEERGQQFDLVFMDVRMPRCDGFAATRKIREAGIGEAQLPIIALTANAYREDIEAALESGMQQHLSKPLTIGALRETLRQWLPERRVARPVQEETAMEDPAIMQPAPPTPIRQDNQISQASASLQDRWAARRAEAIDAVSALLDRGSLDDSVIDEVASLVHKLAGTAGMFGQDELGRKAGELEQVLRRSGEWDQVEGSARALLAAA
ncbi:ATP-binding protein [Paraurantiacibacter namhicola]|uniref:Sensory/regulatory protein RpfC n=1 Tax=Paraurantiacibacter namhicola TaxID=645517 RepID=A0A1C7D737_9SPHN|nr:ATP-binding protein [Paraurantiacibacter namhicola]ANU07113.1 Autoinducer 2 sensor kinase/phosphatase LuxQ [Paraurantiacibacter namhicola]